MIYSLKVFDVMQAIEQAFRGLLGQLCILVYNLIWKFYNLFTNLSEVDILANSDIAQNIYNRVGLILGIFMVFKLTFSLIQALLDPNKLTDKNNGATAIIMRSVIAIVLLGITPTIFKEAYQLQSTIIGSHNVSDNVLYKLILADDSTVETKDFGKDLALRFYFSFFRDDEYPHLSDGIDNEDSLNIYLTDSDALTNLKNKILNDSSSLNETYEYLMATSGEKYIIEFSPLLCLGAGVMVLWMIISYCIQVSIRVFQLAYLQLVAPVPILSYISKPDGAFKKWISQCTATYLDLFMRLVIIYFIMAFSNAIFTIFDNLDNASSSNILLEVFLIIGLLMFAKKVPNLIKELFPSMGGAAAFDFGLNKKGIGRAFTFGAGAALGAAGGLASNAIHSGLNLKNQIKNNGGIKNALTDKDARNKVFKSLGTGTLSMIGGTFGGLTKGARVKNLRGVRNAIDVNNENRKKRELASNAGYKWYNPIKPAIDKIEAFAGETTEAEKQIKVAQFRQEALQQAKASNWQTFAEENLRNGNPEDIALLRTMQEMQVDGKSIWKGINSKGEERTFTFDKNNNSFVATDGSTNITWDRAVDAVLNSAQNDKQIKEQGKIIKGLEAKKRDAGK